MSIRRKYSFSAQEARELDLKAREKFGISTLILMENAGSAVAQEAVKMLRGRKAAAVFCGRGNNGGDGLVAARHLLSRGIKTDIFLAGRSAEVENEAKVNLDILLKLRQKIYEVVRGNLHLVRNKVSRHYLIIDALLGVGLEGEVRGIYRDLIGIINLSKAYILSVDIPSGLDATTGGVLGCCVKAHKSVTFLAKKRGMVRAQGPEYCGKIIVNHLGLPIFT